MVNTIKFSEMTAGGDLPPSSKTPGLLVGGNVLFENPWTFLAPGTTGDRPIPSEPMYYRLRFNTTLEIYEYYDPTIPIWASLSGSGTGTVNPGVANDIAFYAASGQAVSPIAGNINSLLVTNGAGVPSLSALLPTGLQIPGATITASTASLSSGSVSSTPVGALDLVNKAYADGLFSSGVQSLTGTTNQVIFSSATGNVTASLPQDIALGSTPTFAGMTLSSIPLNSASGGSGVNNAGRTITIGGNISFLGAFSFSGTLTGNTAVTFPTSGTLLTSASAVTSIAATTNQLTTSAATGAVTLGLADNAIMPGTGGLTLPSGNTAARAGSAGTIRFNTQTLVFESTVDGVTWAVIDTAASGDVDSITGTANQITASASTGNITLSLPATMIAPGTFKSGNIQLNTNTISSADTNGNLILTPNGTGNLVLDGLNWPQADGAAGTVISTNGSGQLSFVTQYWQLISTVVISSPVATLDFINLSSDYEIYMIDCDSLLPGTDGVAFWLRLSTNNGVSYLSGNDYRWAQIIGTSAPAATGTGSTLDTKCQLGINLSSTAGRNYSSVFFLINPAGAGYTKYTGTSGYTAASVEQVAATSAGGSLATTIHNAFRLMMSSGNIIAGKVKIYGLKA